MEADAPPIDQKRPDARAAAVLALDAPDEAEARDAAGRGLSVRLVEMNDLASATSSAEISNPVVSSPGAEGAQEGIWVKMLMGCKSASSCIKRTPLRPKTFAISWGSVNMEVVPWGMTAAANSAGVSIPLSMCIWASHRPGMT